MVVAIGDAFAQALDGPVGEGLAFGSLGGRQLRLAEVALEHLRRPEPDLAVPTDRQLLQGRGVHDLELDTGDRPAGRDQPLRMAFRDRLAFWMRDLAFLSGRAFWSWRYRDR